MNSTLLEEHASSEGCWELCVWSLLGFLPFGLRGSAPCTFLLHEVPPPEKEVEMILKYGLSAGHHSHLFMECRFMASTFNGCAEHALTCAVPKSPHTYSQFEDSSSKNPMGLEPDNRWTPRGCGVLSVKCSGLPASGHPNLRTQGPGLLKGRSSQISPQDFQEQNAENLLGCCGSPLCCKAWRESQAGCREHLIWRLLKISEALSKQLHGAPPGKEPWPQNASHKRTFTETVIVPSRNDSGKPDAQSRAASLSFHISDASEV